jgi:fibronectin-binding autotransporter adhesin
MKTYTPSRMLRFLAVWPVLTLAIFLSDSSLAIDYTWNTGASGSWSTNTSWTPTGTPGSGDSILGLGATTVAIDVGANRTVTNITTNGTSQTFYNAQTGNFLLTLTGNLTVGSSTTAIRSNTAGSRTLGLEIQGNVNATGGSIRFGNAVSGAGGLNNMLTSLKVDGKTTVNSGLGFTVYTDPTGIRQLAEVENNGTFNIYRAPAAAATGALSVAGLSGNGTTRVSEENNAIAATLTINGNSNFSSSGNLTNGGNNTFSLLKTGAGTQTLTSAASSYTGTTTINQGVLAVSTLANGGSNSTIGASSNSTSNLVLGGGTLRYTGGNVSTDRNFTLTAATSSTIDVSTGATNLTMSGASASTSGNLTKAGTGTLTLTAANLHTGITFVSAGTLVLSGSGSVASSSVIRVASGAALTASSLQIQSGQRLENKGTFTGALTALSGSTYAPGNSPGIATQAGNLTLNTGSTFEWELIGNTSSVAGTNFDQTNFTSGGLTIQTGVTSNLVFNAGSTVDWNNSFWASNQQWLVFTGASSLSNVSGFFTTISVGNDSTGASLASSIRAGSTFAFSNPSGNEVYLNYTAVPEPTTWALLAVGLITVAILRRRSSRC